MDKDEIYEDDCLEIMRGMPAHSLYMNGFCCLVKYINAQNWAVKRAHIHVSGCGHYKKNGGGSGENNKWYSCSSYPEAKKIMNSFGYGDAKDCACVSRSV